MHFDAFDSYQRHPSPVHRLDPRTKVVTSLVFILSAILLPDGAWAAFALSWLLVLSAAGIAGLRLRFLLGRSLVAVPFALAALTVVFTLPGEPAAVINLGFTRLTLTQPGLLHFSGIVIRSWLAVQAAIVLTATTQFPDLVHALRHLRVPALITGIISFMYRYLFVLGDEALRLMRGRESRSAAPGPGERPPSLGWRAGVTGMMVGQLFLRSYARSDRVYHAMQARGYEGHLMTMNPHQMKPADWLTMVGVALLLVLLRLVFTGSA